MSVIHSSCELLGARSALIAGTARYRTVTSIAMSRQGSASTAKPIHSRRVAAVPSWAVGVMASWWTPGREALHAKLAERREQGIAPLGRDALAAQSAQVAGDLSHLVDVLDAGVALGQVLLQAVAVLGGHRAFEVLGHDLDELLAGHLGVAVNGHRSVPS